VLVTPGNPAQPIEIMLQPERDIDPEAVKIHGITTERARSEGVPRQAGIRQIAETIAELAGPEIPLVGHNASYDLTLIDREMRRTGIGQLAIERNVFAQIEQVRLVIGDRVAAVFPVIDTYVLDKAVDRYRKGKRQLSHAAAFYGVPMEDGAAHGATADVFASLRIAWTIAKRCALADDGNIDAIRALYADRRQPADMARSLISVGAMSLPDLHCAQVRWAAEQAEGLRDYFVKNGKIEDAASVDGRWPVRPLDVDDAVETVDTTF
jgi:DNA polymerase-3 subunit epsilon